MKLVVEMDDLFGICHDAKLKKEEFLMGRNSYNQL